MRKIAQKGIRSKKAQTGIMSPTSDLNRGLGDYLNKKKRSFSTQADNPMFKPRSPKLKPKGTAEEQRQKLEKLERTRKQFEEMQRQKDKLGIQKSGGKTKKAKTGSSLGMKSVKSGYDKNPGVTRADIIVAAKGKAKNGTSKKKAQSGLSMTKLANMKKGGKCKYGC